LGFFRPSEGAVFADDVPYEKIDMISLRRSIGVVLQDSIIFPGTIRENIMYGHRDYDQSKLEKILKISMCNEFLKELPEGINTFIKDKRERFSGGEIQRLSIARALIGDNKLIIMDEPSTYLEKDILKNILNNIKNSFPQVSILFISHEKNVAGIADVVFEIRNNTLSEK